MPFVTYVMIIMHLLCFLSDESLFRRLPCDVIRTLLTMVLCSLAVALPHVFLDAKPLICFLTTAI